VSTQPDGPAESPSARRSAQSDVLRLARALVSLYLAAIAGQRSPHAPTALLSDPISRWLHAHCTGPAERQPVVAGHNRFDPARNRRFSRNSGWQPTMPVEPVLACHAAGRGVRVP
jgi:hypothetical protein